MASIHKGKDSPYFRIRFRFDGRNVYRSLMTTDKRRAKAFCLRVEETLALIKRGRLEIPSYADPIEFIFTDGNVSKEPATRITRIGLAKLFELYEERLPVGRKEESTLVSERIHIRHLKKHLGPNRTMRAISKAVLQGYVNKRLKEEWHGKPITPDTVKNELVTFRMLWNWGVKEGLLEGLSPTKDVELPLSDEKLPFMTRGEIEEIISRGGLTSEEEKGLWEALYLSVEQVSDVLESTRKFARHKFIYPMMVFIGHTGCRRSEMVRSKIEDVDFRTQTVLLREKKKSRKKAVTYRRVEMSPLLQQVMTDWLEEHPGGQQTFVNSMDFKACKPLTKDQANYHFRKTLEKTDWKIVRGFHVFRHSFASNLAAAGVDQRIIDEFMGHQTEEMRRRYRHLFPAARRGAIESVFGNKTKIAKLAG